MSALGSRTSPSTNLVKRGLVQQRTIAEHHLQQVSIRLAVAPVNRLELAPRFTNQLQTTTLATFARVRNRILVNINPLDRKSTRLNSSH